MGILGGCRDGIKHVGIVYFSGRSQTQRSLNKSGNFASVVQWFFT